MAHSVVSGIVKGNSVYAGNPAKRIMSVEEYIEKRRSRQEQEAMEYCKKYKESHGIYPNVDKLHEYYFLFTHDRSQLTPVLNDKLKLCGNFDQSVKSLEQHVSLFSSYNEFIECIDCRKTGRRDHT